MDNNIETFCPSCGQDWRAWLELNHEKKEGIWLIIYKKDSPTPNLTWSEAVDEALCFGWIDSIKRPIDSEKYKQYFGKRKANSTWSKTNKEKIEKLLALGLVHKAGVKSIETAKENGSWTILDGVENLDIPNDLDQAFSRRPGSRDYFLSLSKSVRKAMLQGIALAKRPETRQKRIDEIVASARPKKKP